MKTRFRLKRRLFRRPLVVLQVEDGDIGPMPRMTGRLAALHDNGDPAVHWEAPAFTASLDAAVTLVPDGWYWRAGHGVLWPGWAHLNVKHPDHCDYGDEHTAHAETPALALVAASLRAQKEQANG